MTTNQIAYRKLVEEQRANLANEQIKRGSNLIELQKDKTTRRGQNLKLVEKLLPTTKISYKI